MLTTAAAVRTDRIELRATREEKRLLATAVAHESVGIIVARLLIAAMALSASISALSMACRSTSRPVGTGNVPGGAAAEVSVDSLRQLQQDSCRSPMVSTSGGP